jgi:MFS family permease
MEDAMTTATDGLTLDADTLTVSVAASSAVTASAPMVIPPRADDRGTDRGPERSATFREVFAVREYRTLFWADLASLVGDQVAAVAIAVLLYERSGSPLIAALGYATAYLPWVVGGPILAAFADRLPGRAVLVGCDVARAGLIACAVIPGLPLPAVGLLVLLAATLAPPFDAARSALLPQILEGDRYAVGMSVRDMVHQSAQLGGFVGGGALVMLVRPHGALAIDAVTFALSALLLRSGLRWRPAEAVEQGRRLLRDALEGLSVVAHTPRLRAPLLLGITGAAYVIVPEAIATSYAASLGYGPAAVGLIMAAVAAGSVLGSVAVARLVAPRRRRRLMWPLALAGTLPLLVVVIRPGLGASLLLFTLAGVLSSYQVPANAVFAAAVPPGARARAFGVAMSGMYAGQAAAIILAGAAAQFVHPATVIAASGALGLIAVLGLHGSVTGGLGIDVEGRLSSAGPRRRAPRHLAV